MSTCFSAVDFVVSVLSESILSLEFDSIIVSLQHNLNLSTKLNTFKPPDPHLLG